MCIVNVDQNARFLELNTAFEDITGYRRNEVIGRTSTELRLYWDPWDLARSREKLLTEGGSVVRGDVLGQRVGEVVPVLGVQCAQVPVLDLFDGFDIGCHILKAHQVIAAHR